MAIKIPSKNIYEINNPKIRDNVIDNVSVEQTVITPSNDYEVAIKQYESKDFDIGTLNTRARIKYAYTSTAGVAGQYNYALSASLVQLQTTYTKSININIEKLLKNSYISKIYDGKNYNDENNIKFTVYQTVTKQDVYMDIDIPSGIQNQGEQNFTPSSIVVSKTSTTNGTNAISSDYINVENNIIRVIQDTSASIGGAKASISNSISETNKENVSSIKFSTPTGKDYFTANGIIILAGLTVTKMFYQYISGGVAGIAPPSTISLEGTREIYTPERVEITIYGDTIGIDLTDGTVTYIKDKKGNIVQGKGNKPHSLSGNELLQNGSTTNGVLLTEHLANNVLNQYAKGKETATLLCDINEYYNESNELEISTKVKPPIDTINFSANVITTSGTHNIIITLDNDYVHDKDLEFDFLFSTQNKSTNKNFILKKGNNILDITIPRPFSEETEIYTNDTVKEILPMGFQIGDEVIPYVFGANGQDQPMSLKQDGTAKSFRVVGTNKIFDGAVWQELYLQEK